jgi:hypothetical protein
MEATKKLPKPPGYPQLTFEQKYELIATGKAKLRPLSKVYSHTDLEDAYIYPSFEAATKEADREITQHEIAIEKISAPIRKQQNNVLDRIIMSGGEEAMQAIEAFASGK